MITEESLKAAFFRHRDKRFSRVYPHVCGPWCAAELLEFATPVKASNSGKAHEATDVALL